MKIFILLLMAMHGCLPAMEKPSFWKATFNKLAPVWMLSREQQIKEATEGAASIINEYQYFTRMRSYTAYNKFIELIKKGANPNIPDIDGQTALQTAVIYKEKGFIKLLLNTGASLEAPKNVSCVNSIRIFTEAVNQNDFELVQLLLQKGADVNKEGGTVSGITSTPLNIAALNQSLQIVKLLMQTGANPNIQSASNGFTALMAALKNPYKSADPEVIKLLVKSGMDVDKQTTHGYTALMFAASGSNTWVTEAHCYEHVTLLLDAGADRTIRDTSGKTALDHAKAKGQSRIVHLLKATQKIL